MSDPVVIDTSVLLAIIFSEPDAQFLASALVGRMKVLPATVVVEANIVAMNRGLDQEVKQLVSSLGVTIAPIHATIARLAVTAHARFGKGRHKASLNFGDCLVYATATHLDLPLVFKGDDFFHTDVRRFSL